MHRLWALHQCEGYCMSLVTDVNARPLQQPRRKVVIRRDDKDFVIALYPDDIVIYRNAGHCVKPAAFYVGKLSVMYR